MDEHYTDEYSPDDEIEGEILEVKNGFIEFQLDHSGQVIFINENAVVII